MIGWLIFAGYVLAWLGGSVFTTRWIADNYARCTSRRDSTDFRSLCRKYHGDDCWAPNGDITIWRFAAATGLAVAWPLLIPLAASWTVANKRPTVIGLQKDIARLEREAGIR